MDSLVDEIGGNEDHPLASLLELIGNLMESFEASQNFITDANPSEVLRDLMEQHGLAQKDLSDIGSQGVISEILNGKRALNVRQIRALVERFHVSPAVFLGWETRSRLVFGSLLGLERWVRFPYSLTRGEPWLPK